jgi:hypothetical protein
LHRWSPGGDPPHPAVRQQRDVQEVTDVGDDLQRVRGGEPMSVVDLRGEDAAVVGTVEGSSGPTCRCGKTMDKIE